MGAVEILIVIFKLRHVKFVPLYEIAYYPGCSRGFIRKDVPSYE